MAYQRINAFAARRSTMNAKFVEKTSYDSQAGPYPLAAGHGDRANQR
jgi:hypothetical protein